MEKYKTGKLRQTVGLKAQGVLTKLLDAVSVYNIDVTDYCILQDIYEFVGKDKYSLLEKYNVPMPCPLESFVEATCERITNDADREAFRGYIGKKRLLEAYESGDFVQQLEYEILLGDGKVHTILHKLILTENDEAGGIIARCSTRDITTLVNFGKNLHIAEDKIDLGLNVIESLVQDCSVIWIVDAKDRTLELFRVLEKSNRHDLTSMGRQISSYDDTLEDYVAKYVYEQDKERVLHDASLANMISKVESDGVYRINFKHYNDKGKVAYYQILCTRMTSKSSEDKYVLAIKDINETMKREVELMRKQDRLVRYEADQQSMDLIHDAFGVGTFRIDFDEEGQISDVEWSRVFKEMLGYEEDDYFSDEIESWTDLFYGEDRERVINLLYSSIADSTGKLAFDVELRVLTLNRGIRWFRAISRISRREDGTPVTMIGLLKDIDEEKKTSDILEEQLEIVKALSRDFLNVYKVNPVERTAKVIKIDGYKTRGIKEGDDKTYSYDALLRQYIRDRVYPEDRDMMLELLNLENVIEQLEKKSSYVSGYRVIDKGEIHFYQFSYLKVHMNNSGYQIIAGFKNVDEIVNAAKERESLIILSETDIMTGLLNRGSGEKKATQLIGMQKQGMLCILDIDKFKSINDTFGHAVGDKVIISVAQCLKEAFRERDIVFRLGGDEFAVLAVGEIAEENAAKIFDRFFDKIKRINIPEMGDRKVTISVGATLIGNGNSYSFDELYKTADKGVYQSKEYQGNMVTFRTCE